MSQVSNDEVRRRCEAITGQHGTVIWIYGLPSAGKTTLAQQLRSSLLVRGRLCTVLDGDEVRLTVSKGLGFSMEDRAENLRRSAEMARVISGLGIIVIAAFVTPLAEHRRMIRGILDSARCRMAFLNCPLVECIRRDAKGIYRKARLGEIKNVTGVGSDFEIPQSGEPDVILDPSRQNLAAMASTLEGLLH